MPAAYGYAVASEISQDSGFILFGVVTDGAKTEFMFPTETDGESIQDMRIAFGARMEALQRSGESDLEGIVTAMGYNFPVNMFLGNPTDTYEEAAKWLEIIIRSDSYASPDSEEYKIERFTAISPSEAYPDSDGED